VPQPVGTVTSQRPNAQGATRVPAATPSASPALPDYPPRGT
jgi:hypothetical protein